MIGNMNSQQNGMISNSMMQQNANARMMADEMSFLPLTQQLQLQLGASLSLGGGQILTYPRNGINLSAVNYGDHQLSHNLGTDDVLSHAMQGIAYIQPETMMNHQGGMTSDINLSNMNELSSGMEMYSNAPIDQASQSMMTYEDGDIESRLKLRAPKRTMSAYSCYSRSVFKEVREEIGDQARQSDIFRSIALRWKEMPREEKLPFEEEARQDHERYKQEMQQFHRLRREVERSIARYSALTDPSLFKSSKYLQRALHNHDAFRVAQLIIAAGNNQQRDTLDVLQMVQKVLLTQGNTMITEQRSLQDTVGGNGSEVFSHTGRRIYRCLFPGCGKEFAWKSNLNVHTHTHDGSRRKDYICDFPSCNKSFYDGQHLKQHYWIHTRNPEGFQCDQPGCDKKYATHSGLQMHVRSHHKNEKKFMCEYEGCGKGFVRNNDLTQHIMRIHEMERPYKCSMEGCDKAFVSNSELRRHLIAHSDDMNPMVVPELNNLDL